MATRDRIARCRGGCRSRPSSWPICWRRQAVTALQREGARRILACGIHPVLSGPAIDRIKASPIEEIVVTNSIPIAADKRAAGRITVLTVAPLLGEAIRRIHDEESVSTLFV